MFVNRYSNVYKGPKEWSSIKTDQSSIYNWEESSTYVRRPPFFDNLPDKPKGFEKIKDARPLLILGDTVIYCTGCRNNKSACTVKLSHKKVIITVILGIL